MLNNFARKFVIYFVISDLQKTLKIVKKIWMVGNKVGILHSQTTGKEL
jgi:hypothetical protein